MSDYRMKKKKPKNTNKGPALTEYLVSWEMRLRSETPQQAVARALEILRMPKSDHHGFIVVDTKSNWFDIDGDKL